jgi:hypothetical protein
MNTAAESIHKPASTLLRPAPLKPSEEKLSPENATKLQLLAAEPEEWEELERNIEQIDLPPSERRANPEVSAKKQHLRSQELLNNRFGELFIRALIASKGDATFSARPKKDQYLGILEWIGPEIDRIIKAAFPHITDREQLGLLLMNAYASFLEEQHLRPDEEATLREQGEAYLQKYTARILESSTEAGTLSRGDVNRGYKEAPIQEVASPFASATSFEATEDNAHIRHESGTSGMTLAELEARDQPSKSGPRTRTLRAVSASRQAKLPPSPRQRSA